MQLKSTSEKKLDATGHPKTSDSTPPALKSTLGRRGWKTYLPLKIADGYLLSAVFGGMLRGLMWFGGLLLVFSIMSAMSKVMRYSLPPLILLQLVACQLPRLILFTLPAATLFGAVSAFTEMSSSGELTALGVGGMSLSRMLRAPLILGCCLTIIAFVLQESLVPWGESSYQQIIHNSSSKMGVQPDFTLIDRDAQGQLQRVISAKEFDPSNKTLVEPRIQLWNSDHQLTTQIVAQRAEWDEAQGKWFFSEGTQYFFPAAQKQQPTQLPSPVTSHFENLEINTLPNPKAMTDKSVSLQQNLDDQNYEMVPMSGLYKYRAKQPQFMTAAKTPQEKTAIINRTHSLTYGIHDKIATPLMCIIVILLGAPLGVRPQRSGSGFSIGLSLLVLLIYYLVWSAASNMGKEGAGAPLFLAYLPLGIVLCTGLFLLKQKSR